MAPASPAQGASLSGVRVVELSDEQGEYCGLLLAGLGAEVVKVERPGGDATRGIGPFYEDVAHPDRSLFFWAYNRGKRSLVLDPEVEGDRARLLDLLSRADVFLESTAPGYLQRLGLGQAELRARFPRLIVVRISPFGDDGPWADFKASDLVHLALGGPMMNSGYDPKPDGEYDTPPIAPQMWHAAYHIAGEQCAMGIVAALFHQGRTGHGQYVSCAIHEAVAKNTELDLMNWVMRAQPIHRQTCRHAGETVTPAPTINHTKDGRWLLTLPFRGQDTSALAAFVADQGVAVEQAPAAAVVESVGGRAIPGSSPQHSQVRFNEIGGRLWRRYLFEDAPWQAAQAAGLFCAPLRKPHENIADAHWRQRATFAEVEHPELGRSFTYVVSKWLSSTGAWQAGRRAPLVNEDAAEVLSPAFWPQRAEPKPKTPLPEPRLSARGTPFPLQGTRVCDFTWFLASAGAMRFVSAMGAECIKIEWKGNPDTRTGAFAPVGGREARERATGPLPGVEDLNMGGQFNNKNPGKRGISLNVRHPEGLAIARRLVSISDVVAEGFSPGVMDKLGLGVSSLREV